MNINDLQNGDLLFINDFSEIAKAITKIQKNSIYSHVGIYFDKMIYHASLDNGVNKQFLYDYIKKENKTVDVYRYLNIDAKSVKKEAEKYLGLPYNHGFYPDGKGFYCSQFIAKLLPIFDTIPMKFGDETNQVSDYWKEYYKKLGTPIPLNKPGTNPYQLSLSEKLVFVGKLEN